MKEQFSKPDPLDLEEKFLIYFFSDLTTASFLWLGMNLESLKESQLPAPPSEFFMSETYRITFNLNLIRLKGLNSKNHLGLQEFLAAMAVTKINHRLGSVNLKLLNHSKSPLVLTDELSRANLPALAASLKSPETENETPDFLSLVKAGATARRYSQQQLIIPQQKVEVSQVLDVLFNPEVPFGWSRLGILEPDACKQAGEDASTQPLEKRFLARLVAESSFLPPLLGELSYSLPQTLETFDNLIAIQNLALRLEKWHQQPYLEKYEN